MARVAVAGAGIVGLCSAFALHRLGQQVVLVDPDPQGDRASHGNAGGLAMTECVPHSLPSQWRQIPGWLLDPLGPLFIRPGQIPALLPWLWRFLASARGPRVEALAAAMHALNRRAEEDYQPLWEAIGYQHKVRKPGCLVLYNNRKNFQRDAYEWQLKRRQGLHWELLEGEQLKALEPDLGPAKTVAVYQPQWALVNDPKELVDALRQWLLEQGVEWVSSTASAVAHGQGRVQGLHTEAGTVAADQVLVAAGAWSGRLAASAGERALLQSERGYNTTIADPGVTIRHKLVLAEEKFVISPLGCGLRVGGAAEFSGLDAPPNYRRCQALLRLAQAVVPGLRADGASQWMGQRPSTPDTIPVLGPSAKVAGLHYAFGHGHLGLTQGATSGALVAQQLVQGSADLDLSPYAISRFN